jgi:hypothetical protein
MLAVSGKARFRLQHLTPRDAEVIGEIISDLEAGALTDQPPAVDGVSAHAKQGRMLLRCDLCRY